RPEPGVWTVRASGSGLAGVMVKARSHVGITNVEFAAAGSSDFTSSPTRGVQNVVRIGVSGGAASAEGSLVNAAFREIAPLPLSSGDSPGTYVSRFLPGAEGFRVLIKGRLADGTLFQRVQGPLHTAR